ncbi:MAG TPA: hypothetical protein VL326_13495 [Kofleriaceae bacterium]|jgi:hypothetical protein|nr:hypothetical protein [Kofleriaceae bacterium]
MRRAAWLCILLVVVACNKRTKTAPVDQPGSCLALPPALRFHLEPDPRGDGLYWMEAVEYFDYLSGLRSFENLIRYDLRTRTQTVITDHVVKPLLFADGDVYVRRSYGDKQEFVHVDKGKRVHTLTPDYMNVEDVLQLDDKTFALLASGDGQKAVFIYTTDRPHPRYLVDADTLVGHDGKHVLIEKGDKALSVDVTTGESTPFTNVAGATTLGPLAYTVENEQVHAHHLLKGDDHVVIDKKGLWKLVFQRDTILVRTAPKDDRSEAFLIEDGKPTPLASISGGTSVYGTAKLGTRLWALIGHNSANSILDPADTVTESEVCTMPNAGPMIWQSRIVPGRYAAKSDKLMGALMREAPGAGVQIAEDYNYPVAVSVTMQAELAHRDFTKMRERVAQINDAATKLLEDNDVRTEVTWADGWIAIRAWRRDRLRESTSVGMGDALLSNPDDIDLIVKDLVDMHVDAGFECSGSLTNTHAEKLENLEVRCGTDRMHSIKVPVVEGHETVKFSKIWEQGDEDPWITALFEITRNGELVQTIDDYKEKQTERVLDLCEKQYNASKFTLLTHTIDRDIKLSFWAPAEFVEYTDAQRLAIVRDLYRRFQALTTIYELPATTPISVTISVHMHTETYEYDGVQLTKR